MSWRIITAKQEEEEDQDGELPIDLHSFGPFTSKSACLAFIKAQVALRKAAEDTDIDIDYEIEEGSTIALLSPTGSLTVVRQSDLA